MSGEDIAKALEGARLVKATEPEQGARLAESVLRLVTGQPGERERSARELRGVNPAEMTPGERITAGGEALIDLVVVWKALAHFFDEPRRLSGVIGCFGLVDNNLAPAGVAREGIPSAKPRIAPTQLLVALRAAHDQLRIVEREFGHIQQVRARDDARQALEDGEARA